MNPLAAKCMELYQEGYNVSSICISIDGSALKAIISLANYVPLGEGGELARHTVSIDMDKVPKGVSVSGFDRVEDVVLSLPGNAEQAEAMIIETAKEGQSKDWARVDGDTPDYPHWWTKPNAWRRNLK